MKKWRMCMCVQDFIALAQSRATKPDCTITVKGATCNLYMGDGIESLARLVPNAEYGTFKLFLSISISNSILI